MVGTMMKGMDSGQKEKVESHMKNMGVSKNKFNEFTKRKAVKKDMKASQLSKTAPVSPLFSINFNTEIEKEDDYLQDMVNDRRPDIQSIRKSNTLIRNQFWNDKEHKNRIVKDLLESSPPTWSADLISILPVMCTLPNTEQEVKDEEKQKFISKYYNQVHLQGEPLVHKKRLFQYKNDVWTETYTFEQDANNMQINIIPFLEHIKSTPVSIDFMNEMLEDMGLVKFQGTIYASILPKWPAFPLFRLTTTMATS